MSFRDSSKPAHGTAVSGTLNRTQSLVEVGEGGMIKSKQAPRRPVRIISFLSQASACPSEDPSSYASSLCRSSTPVEYVNTLFGSPNDTSHEIIEHLSLQYSQMLTSFLLTHNLYSNEGYTSSTETKSLLEFSIITQVDAKLCAMLLLDVVVQISHKFFESPLTGVSPYMFHVVTNKSSATPARPRLLLRWDAVPSKKLAIKPDPSKVSDVLAIVVYICYFRSFTSSISSILQHVNSSVLVPSFFKSLISSQNLFTCSPSLVQCYIACFLGWLPTSFANLFLDCSRAVPSCNWSPLASRTQYGSNDAEVPIMNPQLIISTSQLWLKLERSKLANHIFSKLLSQSDRSKNEFSASSMFDDLHDRSVVISNCSAYDVCSAIKTWAGLSYVDAPQSQFHTGTLFL